MRKTPQEIQADLHSTIRRLQENFAAYDARPTFKPGDLVRRRACSLPEEDQGAHPGTVAIVMETVPNYREFCKDEVDVSTGQGILIGYTQPTDTINLGWTDAWSYELLPDAVAAEAARSLNA